MILSNRNQLWFVVSSILLVFISLSPVSAAPSACTSDFVQGKCICRLATGAGTLDLTPLVEKTGANPLSATDPDNRWSYYFSFCAVQTNKPDFNQCYQQASVCQYAEWSPNLDQVDGWPNTTTFEMRTTANDNVPRLALVTDVVDKSGFGTRSVAFLTCDPGAGIPFFLPATYTAEKDPVDGYLLYYFEIKHQLFCVSGGSGGESLSAGSILLIIFFSTLFVYFFGGFLLLTLVYKREGADRIPHHAFWADLPGLAKDGVMFSIARLRGLCGNSGIQELK